MRINSAWSIANTYDAYGNTFSSTGSVSNPFGYTGEYTDSESGFVYLRARYYDPESQQFLTVDPALAWTEQAYAYVAGDPTNATDPLGDLCAGPRKCLPSGLGPLLICQIIGICPPPPENRPDILGALLNIINFVTDASDPFYNGSLKNQCTCQSPAATAVPPNAGQTIGDQRLQRVLKHFGLEVVDWNRKVNVPGLGSTDIDVVLTGKRFIEVGGPAKGFKMADFGRQLQKLKAYADQEGGQAFFYYDVGTPQNVINLAAKWLGAGNVLPIP
jgi:RHS repeat-associated protein